METVGKARWQVPKQMMERKSIVVTGASTGIGKACVLHLGQCGFRVFAGVRKMQDGEALAREASGEITPLLLDVTDPAGISAAAVVLRGSVGDAGLQGLVNNAGIVVSGMLELLPLEELRKQFEVNVFGQVAVTQALLPMLRQGRGRVVNMGSIAGRIATPLIGAYSASKFALEAVSDTLRMELRPWGIHVSIIEPGSIATPIWQKSSHAAGALLQRIPRESRELYREAIDAVSKAAMKEGAAGIPAMNVAKAVAHALTAKNPRTRYLVGSDAKFRAFLKKAVPDRTMDFLITRALGLA